jgi:hypothetical protein
MSWRSERWSSDDRIQLRLRLSIQNRQGVPKKAHEYQPAAPAAVFTAGTLN